MPESIELTPRTLQYGAGIYEVGDPEKCCARLFVTDTGFVLPVSLRVLGEEDLLDVYQQGRMDGQAEALAAGDGGSKEPE